jgi:hypothetical protein
MNPPTEQVNALPEPLRAALAWVHEDPEAYGFSGWHEVWRTFDAATEGREMPGSLAFRDHARALLILAESVEHLVAQANPPSHP